jgi:anti-anti-sigma factor
MGPADHPQLDGHGVDHVGRGRDANPNEEVQVSEVCRVAAERRGDVAVLSTDGYINNQGGEEIARQAYAQLESGARSLVLNLEKTRIVNSIGISILIEVLEKVMDRKGKLVFCGLTPTIDKTFRIMGLAQYAAIFPTEADAVRAVSP